MVQSKAIWVEVERETFKRIENRERIKELRERRNHKE
jgi:hypothetical protein